MMTDHVKTLVADHVDFEASDNSLAADPARMPVAMNQ
jgi:hypothetical protein